MDNSSSSEASLYLKMPKQRGHMKSQKHAIDYNVIGRALRKYCYLNVNDLSPEGQYGQASTTLGWSNSRKNRKYLKLIWVSNRGNVQNVKEKGGFLANDLINDYEPEITDKKNEALSQSQEESSSCKKEHERYPSECVNETISDDMHNDDAAVKVCVEQYIKSGGKNLKSSRNRLSLNRKKKPIVIPEDKDTIEKTSKAVHCAKRRPNQQGS